MARSTTLDPLDKYRFAVIWHVAADNQDQANTRLAFMTCQAPKRTTTKITYREGIDSDIHYNSAGLSVMEDITLTRGMIVQTDDDFTKWAKAVHNPTVKKGEVGSPSNSDAQKTIYDQYRHNVEIRMFHRSGKIAKAWMLYQAFPVSFVGGSDLDAMSDDTKAIESITLAYDDFVELVVSADGNSTSEPAAPT